MPKEFQGLGLELMYPDNWKLEEESESLTVMIESPQGAFMSISLEDGSPESSLAKMAAAMHEDYDEIETEACELEVPNHSLSGITQRFVYLDMIVISHIFSIAHDTKHLAIQLQGEDRDMQENLAVFQAILASINFSG